MPKGTAIISNGAVETEVAVPGTGTATPETAATSAEIVVTTATADPQTMLRRSVAVPATAQIPAAAAAAGAHRPAVWSMQSRSGLLAKTKDEFAADAAKQLEGLALNKAEICKDAAAKANAAKAAKAADQEREVQRILDEQAAAAKANAAKAAKAADQEREVQRILDEQATADAKAAAAKDTDVEMTPVGSEQPINIRPADPVAKDSSKAKDTSVIGKLIEAYATPSNSK